MGQQLSDGPRDLATFNLGGHGACGLCDKGLRHHHHLLLLLRVPSVYQD